MRGTGTQYGVICAIHRNSWIYVKTYGYSGGSNRPQSFTNKKRLAGGRVYLGTSSSLEIQARRAAPAPPRRCQRGSKQKRRSEATSSLAEIETLRADRRWIARGRGSSCPPAKATTAHVRLRAGTSVLLLTLSRTRILGNPSPSCGPRSSSQMPTGLCPLGLTPGAVSDRPPVSKRRAGSCVAGRGTQLDCRRPDQPRLETAHLAQ